VFCAALVAYIPALFGDFIWNDSDYVTAPALRSLHGLYRIWFEVGATQQYYPLLHSMFWLQHRLWGDHPFGYHVFTLLLHAGSAVLFALVLGQLFPDRQAGKDDEQHAGAAGAAPAGIAWVAALLFALHPVHVQSVAWISEEKNTLSLVFYLGAALCYLGFDGTRRPAAYAAATALFACSLLCKTMTASLPAALLVIFWWKRGRLGWRRDLLPLLPWLAVGAAAGLFSGWVERHYGGATGDDFDLTLAERVLVAGRAIWFYAGHVVWPFGLNFVYARWTLDSSDWRQWLFPLGVAAVAAVLWAIRRRSRGPLATFLLFVGSLFPALGFVNLYGARYSWVWDHWQYLPDLAPLAAIAVAITAGVRKLGRQPALWASVPVPALLALLGVLSWRHCGMFHDNITLYRRTLARNPGCWLAYNNLGYELDKDPAHSSEAVALYEEALRLNPGFAEAHNSLGADLEKIPGRVDDAIGQYEAALKLKPDFAEAHYNLGNALGSLGRTRDAIAQYEDALRYKPGYPQAHYNLGNALNASGLTADAILEYKAALALDPNYAEAHNNLGLALARSGRISDAIDQYQEALRSMPNIPETHANLGLAFMRVNGRAGDAIAQFREALRINPDYADAHFFLANALIQEGQVPDAIIQYEEALRIHPDFPEASNNLGMVLCRIGRNQEGMARIDAAIRMKPDFAQAHFARGAALLQAGRKDEAVEEYERVLALRPSDPTALRILQYLRNSQ
jgi:tetratricopeptide (TPR) repeat protein